MKRLLPLVCVGLASVGANAHNVDFDKIQYWTGEGDNRAALVVQFNDELRKDTSYVYGFRWADGETPNGFDMIRAVCNNQRSLYLLTQYTGSMGNTICGIGMSKNNPSLFDALYFDFEHAQNESGNAFDFWNSGGGPGGVQTAAPGAETPDIMQAAIDAALDTHVIDHPLDQATYGYPSYDYDSWFLDAEKCIGGDESWQSGWYVGYWSYWVADAPNDVLGYSGWGATSRMLVDGSVDGWSFSDLSSMAAAPCETPEKIVYEGFERGKSYIGIVDLADDATEIHLTTKRIFGLMTYLAPDTQLVKADKVTLSDATREDGNPIATIYQVNYWDENNNRIQFYEVSGHYPGEAKVTIQIGDVTRELKIVVSEQDRTEKEYTDGTFILNEEWFGHTNGGMNYIDEAGNMHYQVYEQANPFMSFGCTSQYGTIWADKLIVASKQASDGGDPLPGGGRLVVADAKTLKRIGSIDELKFGDESSSADGRAIVGASPSRIYVGSTNGVYIVDLNDVTIIGKVQNIGGDGQLYSGQIGDMVNAGRYVFGIRQSEGVFVIDTETDAVVHTIPSANIQGVTQSSDGNVWYVETIDNSSNFVCLDPVTFEELDREILPSEVGKVECSWGAWRSTQFYGNKKANELWFVPSAGWDSGNDYYRWRIGEDNDSLVPFFSLEGKTGSTAAVAQKTYGTIRFDHHHNQLIAMSTEAKASGHYRYNWTYLVNGETREVDKEIALEPYYWFQSMPIFPDIYDAQLDLDDIYIELEDGEWSEDLKGLLSDADDIDANISVELLASEQSEATQVAEVTLEGTTLRIIPSETGTQNVNLALMSNGRLTNRTIVLTVDGGTSIATESVERQSISCDGKRLHIVGCNNSLFDVYAVNGVQVFSFMCDSDDFIAEIPVQNGIYIISGTNGVSAKVSFNK